MPKIFKKLFSLKVFSKKIFLVFLIFTLFVLFCPFSFTNAQWGTIGKALLFLPNAVITVFLQLVILLVRGVFELANWLLGWTMGNPFNVSFTDPAGNPVIRVGWILLRDIVNMLFILGLAYIGLATSLNFLKFETKKIFANLLLIALIINFTPVICGVIVDISNILSNFFLRNADFADLVSVYEIFQGSVWDMVTDIFNFVALLKTLLLITYGILGSLILFLFALLFLVRGPIIWILVILSPLAFFSWIFPKTKGIIWDKWWNLFLQWSFIVVPASFFLYLSQQVIVKKDELLNISGTDPAGGMFAALAPYFVALMFMIFGFVITLQISAIGSGAIIGIGKAAKAKGGMLAKKAGKGAAAGLAAGVAGAARGAKEEKGVKGRITGAAKGALTRAGREKGREAAEKILEKAHLVRPGFYEEKRRKRWKIDEEAKRLKTLPSERLHGITKRKAITSGDVAGKMAAFEVLAGRGKLKDEEKELIPQAETFGVDLDEVEKARPDWAPITQSGTVEKLIKEQGFSEDEAKKEVTKKTIEKMTPRKFRDRVQSEALKNIDVFAALDAQKIKDLGMRGSMKQRKQLVETVNSDKLFDYVSQLDKAGKRKEADKVLENMVKILDDANFQGPA